MSGVKKVEMSELVSYALQKYGITPVPDSLAACALWRSCAHVCRDLAAGQVRNGDRFAGQSHIFRANLM